MCMVCNVSRPLVEHNLILQSSLSPQPLPQFKRWQLHTRWPRRLLPLPFITHIDGTSASKQLPHLLAPSPLKKYSFVAIILSQTLYTILLHFFLIQPLQKNSKSVKLIFRHAEQFSQPIFENNYLCITQFL